MTAIISNVRFKGFGRVQNKQTLIKFTFTPCSRILHVYDGVINWMRENMQSLKFVHYDSLCHDI